MELYKRVWPYSRRYLKWTMLAILCTIVVSATSGLTAWLIKPVINEIFVKRDRTYLALLPFAAMALFVAKGVFSYLQAYYVAFASAGVIRDVRDDLYARIIRLPIRDYNNTSTGQLIGRLVNDVGLLSRLAADTIKGFLQQSFTLAGLLVVLFWRDWRLAGVSILVFPAIGWFVSKYGKKTKGLTGKSQAAIATLLERMQESFTGIRIVKTFTMEEGETRKFKSTNESYTKLAIRTAKVSNRVGPSMDILSGVGVAAIILYGGNKVIGGSMTAGDFFSFTAALMMIYPPVKALGSLHNSMQQAMAGVERIFEFFDRETEDDAPGKTEFKGIEEGIEYRDVHFVYDAKNASVLKGVNLEIKKGEVVALVGSSGGGKTTIVNLLPRFYEAGGGAVLIDGVDVRQYSLRSLRGSIAVVTQDTILFNDTVKNNITYGRENYSMEDVKAAAKAAHADVFIEGMPEGYETMIGEKGVRLSGGEKQRLSIARAILKDSPILILDEATSSLDTESERVVQDALENLMKGRTTLVIAHRLSTVINADKIAVIDKGVVAAVGRHSELLETSPLYARLYEMQFLRARGGHVGAV